MRQGFFTVASALFTFSVTVVASAAVRAELPRVVVVLEENVDGKKATTGAAEVALTSSLMKDGYRVVSGEMADKLRKNQAVSLAMQGGVPPELSSLDADIVILGQINAVKVGVIQDVGLVGYKAPAIAKLIRVDTAQIVDALQTEGKGQDFADASAALKAQKSAGEELARAIKQAVQAMAKKPQIVDLVIHGIPDRAQVDAVKAGLGAQRGVSSVVVRQSGKGLTKIEVTVLGDGESLATGIEKTGLPLEIVQTSASSILLRYDPKRGVRLGAVVLPPTVKLAARGAWVEKALPSLVRAELMNVAYLDVLDSGGVVHVALEVIPAQKGAVQLTASIKDAATKQKLFMASSTGELEALPEIVSAVVKKIDDGFLPALAKAKTRSGNEALARAQSVGKAKAHVAVLPIDELRIESLKLENVFPAKLGYYQANPVGKIVISHVGVNGQPAENVRVAAYVPRFTQLATEIDVGTLKPGERREVPIKLTLDSSAVFAIEENTPTQAEITVDYAVAGGKMNARRVAPLVVYGRRAIDWSEETPIVAFVTPQEENVRAFARGALGANVDAKGAPLPESITQAISLFQAMGAAELKYVKDPVLPTASGTLDSVQFPRETLAQRSGDCDDLSVLYASLLESVGVETAFLLVPGHVLLAVATGTPVDALERVTADASRVLVHDGRAYLPVETTLVGKSFREAWAAGAASTLSAQKATGAEKLVVVPTRQGWARFPPAALPRAAALGVPKVDAQKAGGAEEARLVRAERDTALGQRIASLRAGVAKDPAGADAFRLAALLARTGDVAGARAVMDAAQKKSGGALAVENNLANLDVLTGDAKGAVARYKKILDGAGDAKKDVLTNLGIAYASVGDKENAATAFDAALKSGGVELFLATGFERDATSKEVATSKTRAADDARLTVAEQELKSALAKALEKRKQLAQQKPAKPDASADRFSNPLPSGARRGDDPQSRLRTAELLRWL